jgi:DNA-binding MarR family transcriptional regulator
MVESMSSPPRHAEDATGQVVEAWGRERPDLDASSLEVFSRVTRLAKYLDQVRQEAFGRYGLQGWVFDVLAELRRSGEPYELTPGQMSAAILLSTGAMTNRLNRIEAAGLIERHEDPNDGRVVRVRLTKAGRQRVDDALADLLRCQSELLAPISQTNRTRVAATLAKLLVPFEWADDRSRAAAARAAETRVGDARGGTTGGRGAGGGGAGGHAAGSRARGSDAPVIETTATGPSAGATGSAVMSSEAAGPPADEDTGRTGAGAAGGARGDAGPGGSGAAGAGATGDEEAGNSAD